MAALSLLFATATEAAPLYAKQFAFTNSSAVLGGINNAGDVTGWYLKDDQYRSAFLMRDGVVLDLFPVGQTPAVDAAYANTVSQRKADGSVNVLGNLHVSDGHTRGAIWTVAANGTFTLQVLSNLVLPPESTAPGEQGSGDAVAMNQAGLVVGNGNSYRAAVGLQWTPPYGPPLPIAYGTITAAVTVDDQGTVLLNGVELDHGGPNNRWNASLRSSGGTLQELPYWSLGLGDQAIPVEARAMNGARVVGHAAALADGKYHACVWTNGAATLFALPDPIGMPVQESEGQSVNAAGDVVGYAYVARDASTSYSPGYYTMLWKNSAAGYTGYVLTALFSLENRGTGPLNRTDLRINDNGSVALIDSSANPPELRVYTPVTDGIVQLTSTGFYAAEEDPYLEARVKLIRADANAGPVTVAFTTVDGDAIAGSNYVAQSGTVTWNPGESGEKPIRIVLINDTKFASYTTFNLALTAVTGSQLGTRTNASVVLAEAFQTAVFTNQWLAQYNGYAVQSGETNVLITLVRSGGTDGTMIITNFTTFDGSALDGLDYVGVNNNTIVTWAPGQAGTVTYSVPLRTPPFLQPTISFGVAILGYIDDPVNAVSAYAQVFIVPAGQKPQPQFETVGALVQNDTLNLTSFLTQGSTLVVEGSTNLITWKTVVELKSSNGLVQFNPAILQTLRGQFYRSHVK